MIQYLYLLQNDHHNKSSQLPSPNIHIFFLVMRTLRSTFKNNFQIYNTVFFKKFILFIFGCIGSLLLRVGFLQLWQAGATLCCSARASHCSGFSCCGSWALGTRTSVVVAHGLSSCGLLALEHGLSSCGARAQLLRGTWDLCGPRLEPMSPALAGRFLTTVPPGKSLTQLTFDWRT